MAYYLVVHVVDGDQMTGDSLLLDNTVEVSSCVLTACGAGTVLLDRAEVIAEFNALEV